MPEMPSKQDELKKNLQADKYSPQRLREYVAKNMKLERTDPDEVFSKLAKVLREHAERGRGELKFDDETKELADRAMSIVNFDNHYLLAIATSPDYRSFSIELANQLIKEHSCTTASEKALVQMIVSAYIRSLEYARQLSDNTGPGKIISYERNGMYSFLSKEIDRANRQFITGLTTLKQLKAPSLTVNVKTNAAFIAQNQQINAAKPEPNYEIN